ncbi:hypothetical protein [Cohnella sp. GbtcB17]|uniref:hypothetical protein n=1 Tax=Cohnella sp. GbtcB17 TaxID=2824762 RepID=UPI001C30E02E|nr:hypothetical protein [Cohnella sp. GbtcB17]
MLLTYSSSEVKKEIRAFKKNEVQNGFTSLSSKLNGKEISILKKVVYKSDGTSTAGFWS